MYEPNCLVKVDEFGFFIYWKSDGRVRMTYLEVEGGKTKISFIMYDTMTVYKQNSWTVEEKYYVLYSLKILNHDDHNGSWGNSLKKKNWLVCLLFYIL